MDSLTRPQPTVETVQVSQSALPLRIDRYLTQAFPLYSRSFFQRLIEQSCIQINTHKIEKPSIVIRPGDIITVQFPTSRIVDLTNPAIKGLGVKLIYEHAHFLILYKPAHVLVHPAPSKQGAITIVDWLLAEYQELCNVGYMDRPGIVHRLDKDTSGLLIISRTNYAHIIFTDLFKNRAIQKTYHAVVQGHPTEQGSIDFAIGRDPVTKIKMASFPTSRSNRVIRSALTHYRVIRYLNNAALLELKPVTGRTHQIRVHCTALGHPLIGDHIYGEHSPLINRQALHASALQFQFDGVTHTFASPLPTDMEQLVNQLTIN